MNAEEERCIKTYCINGIHAFYAGNCMMCGNMSVYNFVNIRTPPIVTYNRRNIMSDEVSHCDCQYNH